MFHVALTMKRRVVGIIVRYCRFLGVDERDVGQMLGGEEPTVAHGTQRKNRRMVGGKRPVDFKSNGVGGGAQGIRRNIQITCFGRFVYLAFAPTLRPESMGARSDTLIGRLKKYP